MSFLGDQWDAFARVKAFSLQTALILATLCVAATVDKHSAFVLLASCLALFYFGPKQSSDSSYLDSCTEHTTANACLAHGSCAAAKFAFASDAEWAKYRREVCLGTADRHPNTRQRLLRSYAEASCKTNWEPGDNLDCSTECALDLREMENTINNYTCPSNYLDDSSLEAASLDSLANIKTLNSLPFVGSSIGWFWALSALVVTAGLFVANFFQ